MLSTRPPGCGPGTSGGPRCASSSDGKSKVRAQRSRLSDGDLTMSVIAAPSIVDLKQQLADCLRMLEKCDVIDYNGHCSTRIADDRILINIGSCQRSLATADL